MDFATQTELEIDFISIDNDPEKEQEYGELLINLLHVIHMKDVRCLNVFAYCRRVPEDLPRKNVGQQIDKPQILAEFIDRYSCLMDENQQMKVDTFNAVATAVRAVYGDQIAQWTRLYMEDAHQHGKIRVLFLFLP